jgi:hypothetical protein
MRWSCRGGVPAKGTPSFAQGLSVGQGMREVEAGGMTRPAGDGCIQPAPVGLVVYKIFFRRLSIARTAVL